MDRSTSSSEQVRWSSSSAEGRSLVVGVEQIDQPSVPLQVRSGAALSGVGQLQERQPQFGQQLLEPPRYGRCRIASTIAR